ncbi:MAG: formimidoylglutamase [Bacteroidales bacterium]
MPRLITYSRSEILKRTQCRVGEEKFGERIKLYEYSDNCIQQLEKQDTTFVILGIPEDIGVRANLGRPGTATAWDNFLDNFLNIQNNRFCKGEWITLLGELDFSEEMVRAAQLNPKIKEQRKEMFGLVEQIDEEVVYYVSQIISSGKIPIIVGGGHNNAYGNIKGFSQAKGTSVNVINFDAHTDLRPMKGRHSGNGFSYSMKEGFLESYFIFGLHENYISKGVLNEIRKIAGRVKYNTYEEICVRGEKSFEDELKIAQKHIENKHFGLEIDLDSIPMIASSAITPSGFSAEETRRFLYHFASLENVGYLHLCEGAPVLGSDKNPNLIGKFISYLITDFIKANINTKTKMAVK